MKNPETNEWLTTEWTQPVKALLLDRDESTYEFVVVGIADCATYQRMGISPDPMYLEYRYRNGAWRRVSLSTFSVGRLSNLLVPIEHANETGHVTIAEKRRRNRHFDIFKPHRQIDLNAQNVCTSAR